MCWYIVIILSVFSKLRNILLLWLCENSLYWKYVIKNIHTFKWEKNSVYILLKLILFCCS